MAKAEFYIYVHRKADTGEVFYVGKGKGGRAFAKIGRNNFWHNVVKAHGFTAEIVEYFESESRAFRYERALIAHLRASGVRLCNATDGGEGPSGAKRSVETRQKMSKAMTGLKHGPFSDETRARMSASAIGRKMSQEAIEKTAAAHRGRKRPPETLVKMSASLKGKGLGRKWTEETRERFSAARKGKPLSEQARKNISAGHATRTQYASMSEDHKKKIMAGQAAYWERKRKEKQQSEMK